MFFLIVEENIPNSINKMFSNVMLIRNTHMALVVRSKLSRTIEPAHRKRRSHQWVFAGGNSTIHNHEYSCFKYVADLSSPNRSNDTDQIARMSFEYNAIESKWNILNSTSNISGSPHKAATTSLKKHTCSHCARSTLHTTLGDIEGVLSSITCFCCSSDVNTASGWDNNRLSRSDSSSSRNSY